jgi:Fe2+ transport system protein FeoA
VFDRWRKRGSNGAVRAPAGVKRSQTSLSNGVRGDHLVVLGFTRGLRCAQRLRELGLTEGKVVVVLRAADPVLVALGDSRIAIERRVGDSIEVELVR